MAEGKQVSNVKYYSPAEERLNIYSHALGFFLSIIGTVLLLVKAIPIGDGMQTFSVAVFGLSLCILYAASTTYHATQEPEKRSRLRVVDHASIYVLIAGTYTPFSLITLSDSVGWYIFGIVWSMAIVGIGIKLFFTGRFSLLSTILYVLMGWLIVFAMKPLSNSLAPEGVQLLVAGGLAYTVGAVLYSIKKIPFNHAIFHVFVLIGSIFHFLAVYWYVLS